MATPAASNPAKPRPRRAPKAADAASVDVKSPAQLGDERSRILIGDCREVLANHPDIKASKVDLVFADPPFNWNRDYDRWKAAHASEAKTEYRTWQDGMPREDYLTFTREWITLCASALRPGGALWINIPDDTAAEIVVFVKNQLKFEMVNWCIWHYRFGQNRKGAFIHSKVHALYFVRPGGDRTWNATDILEPSDRATTYFDPRTLSKKDGVPAGLRVPMDVWYGPYWGRIQGNNKERRHGHDNQLPEAYLERVLLCSSKAGDLVLDPFVGSGTTAVMARHYGRRFIGSEFSLANAKSAWQRISEKGPHEPGKALKQSSAIHQVRSASAKAKAKFKAKPEHAADERG